MTNGDKIRNLSDEELVIFLLDEMGIECRCCANKKTDCPCITPCTDGILKWLKQEAVEEEWQVCF